MGMQVKAFGMLFAVLFAVDALACHGHYRTRVAHGVGSIFGAHYGPGSPNYKPVRTR